MRQIRSLLGFLLVSLWWSGCTSSCLRGPSYALLPSDSLSIKIAAKTPVLPLQEIARTKGPQAYPLRVPRTVLFGPDGWLYVADPDRNEILVFDTLGVWQRTMASPLFRWPYLSGWRADTLVVYSPPVHQMHMVHGGEVKRSFTTPEGTYTYTVAQDSLLYFKRTGEEEKPFITRLTYQGEPISPQWFPAGPFWRYVGPLRLMGDTLLSFCAYRPVLDRLFIDGRSDTLFLKGFDSSMLARSKLFMQGEVDEPPLLIASGMPIDTLLFVLNVRPGWVRVDVYNREGWLQAVFEPDSLAFQSEFFPMDLAVRSVGSGIYQLAVTFLKPEPMLRIYRVSLPDSIGIATSIPS